MFLNETSAIDLAELYGAHDGTYDELMQAVERAYPKPVEQFEVLGALVYDGDSDDLLSLRPRPGETAEDVVDRVTRAAKDIGDG